MSDTTTVIIGIFFWMFLLLTPLGNALLQVIVGFYSQF
jgi:hypothetical protein